MKKRRCGPDQTPGSDVLGQIAEALKQTHRGALGMHEWQAFVEHRNPFEKEARKKVVATQAETSAASASPKIFTITTSGKPASELKKLGKYDWANDAITDKRFPIAPHAPVTRRIELVEFDYDVTSEAVIADLARRGLARPTYEDALQFGVEHSEEQRKHPVVFLHEPARVSFGRRSVLVLYVSAGVRYLDLRDFAYGWGQRCVFAGVRE